MNNYRFYDTSSLLMITDSLDENSKIAISSITLTELENIKASSSKDEHTRYCARRLLNYINNHLNSNNLDIILYQATFPEQLKVNIPVSHPLNDDARIIYSAIWYDKKLHPDDVTFVTNDISQKLIANTYFGSDSLESIQIQADNYTGYIEVQPDEEELIAFYRDASVNRWNALTGQYLVVKDCLGDVIDVRCWDGESYRYLTNQTINSKWFGKLVPFKSDIYQKMAFDCLAHNQLTVLRGSAGVGKSLLGFAYLFHLLETYQINKIYIFCNPVATKDSAKLGFYPGDRNMKLLDSQIGNFLIGKLGDITAVEKLVSEGKLVLIPVADCRGMDISSNAGVYVTEAQNSTTNIMKLILQRIGNNVKCVIEGDEKTQVDLLTYEGNNNGLTRLSQVFRGKDFYGEVKLQNCYRSEIAAAAELM